MDRGAERRRLEVGQEGVGQLEGPEEGEREAQGALAAATKMSLYPLISLISLLLTGTWSWRGPALMGWGHLILIVSDLESQGCRSRAC